MKSKKISKLTKKDKEWQEKVEKQLQTERVILGHLHGKERFEEIIKRTVKKKRSLVAGLEYPHTFVQNRADCQISLELDGSVKA